MISHIKLEQFKKVTNFETDLDDINVLVGANNSGKSSVLQGIQFTILAEVVRRNLGRTTVAQDSLLYLPSSDFSVLRHGNPYTNYSGYTSTLSLTSDSETNGVNDSFQITLSKGRNYGNISISAVGNNKFRQQVTSYKELYSAYTPGLAGIPLSERLVSPAVLRNAAANGDANLYLRNILYYVAVKKELAKLNQYIQTVFPGYNISVPHDPNTDVDISVKVLINGKSIPLELCGTGFLQVVQIMAYSVYFRPKMLLLDEPDEHLHPSNQFLLCDAIKLLTQEMGLQVVLSTHSRHMISALDGNARFIWMKNGEVCRDSQSSNFYNVLLDLGALDTYDAILQGTYTTVILTEDSDTKYLKKILETNGCNMHKTLIIPYSSCSHLDSAIQLANFIKNSARTCKVIIHRDRDFMTEDEISVVKQRFESEHLPIWITDECDIEAYFTTVAHISEITGKSEEDVLEWQNRLIQENHVEIQHKFESKRNDIRATMYRDNKLKKKSGDEVRWPDFMGLFGTACPTSRANVVGKFLLKKCNQNMKLLTEQQVNLLANSRAIQVPSLRALLTDA